MKMIRNRRAVARAAMSPDAADESPTRPVRSSRRNASVIDTSVAASLCPGRAEPRVAVCIAGGPRSLAKPQVHLSVRRHFVEGFGGSPTIFWHLNMHDPVAGSFRESTLKAARAALPPTMQRLNVDDGTAYIISKGHAPNLRCFNNSDMGRRWRHWRVMAHYSNMEGCYDLLSAYEQRERMRFDWVLWTRADVAFYLSLAPFCLWDPSSVYYSPPPTFGDKTWTGQPAHVAETAVLVPRAFAEHALRDLLHIFSHARPGDAVCDAHVGHPEAFIPIALNASTPVRPPSMHAAAPVETAANFDRAQRTPLRLRRVPYRYASIPAVIVRQRAADRLACGNWGVIQHALPHLAGGPSFTSCRPFVYPGSQPHVNWSAVHSRAQRTRSHPLSPADSRPSTIGAVQVLVGGCILYAVALVTVVWIRKGASMFGRGGSGEIGEESS